MYAEDLAGNGSGGLYPRPLAIGDPAGVNGFVLYVGTDRILRLYTNAGVKIESTAGTITLNTWQHVVIKRNSGTWRMLINGVSEGTYASSSTINFSTGNKRIGVGHSGSGGFFAGYISDFKIEFSSDSSTSLTPPTSPVSSSGAELHVKGTDASIIDKAQSTNLVIPTGGINPPLSLKSSSCTPLGFCLIGSPSTPAACIAFWLAVSPNA